MGWLSKIAEMGDAARESGPVLFEMAKLHHDVALKRAATKALRAVFNIDDVDFDINKYHNYSEFVKTFERQGRLTDAKQQSVPEIASPVETQPHVAALRSRAAALPESYEQRAAALAAESHTFRQELAAQLAPALNAHIQAMPHETLDQKKELARWVNEELERFGLAVQCPKTGLPAKLRGTAGNWPGVGTFCYQIYRNGKPEKSAYSDTLPELTLMDAIPPKESQVTWQQAVGPKESRASRRR